MFSALQCLLFIGATVGLAYHQVSRWVWISVLAALLLIGALFIQTNPILLLIIGIIFISAALLSSVTILRQKLITQPLLRVFNHLIPPMSNTERDAIDAGDVWWEAELFRGRPHWPTLLGIAKPVLSSEEQAFLDHQVETLCQMIDDWKIQEAFNIPEEAWSYIKRERFLGMAIPKVYGGLGFSALAHSTVVAKIATRSVSTAVNTMVPNSLGPGELLQHYGTEEQKNYYLPRLAIGEEIPCFALTAPDAGSDAGAITDNGVVCHGEFEGKTILGIRLNWNKRYITLSPVATLLGLAFKLYDPDHLLGTQVEIGITLCLIPTHHTGVEIGTRHCPLGIAFLNGPTRGKDVFIPLDWLIGGVALAGQGWRMLMECLSIGRAISLPALSTGGAKLCYRTTGAYARLRKQFKLSIGQFEGIEEALGRIGAYTYLLEATRLMTTGAVDQQIRPTIASAIAKYNMTEGLRKVVNDAMDVHAGRGIQLGPRNYLGVGYLSIPISITVEGANILTRNLIIFGQGLMRCHPYLHAEMNAAANPDKKQGLKDFDRTLLQHLGYAISNGARCFVMSLTGGRHVSVPVSNETSRYYRQLTRMSTALAFLTEIAMLVLGGKLKRKERLSARLGDILSQLYLGSAVLKYHADQHYSSEDLPYIHWNLQFILHQIEIALLAFCENFPRRFLGKCLKRFIFPCGRTYPAPADYLSHQIAKSMMLPSDFRDRLTRDCYVSSDIQDAVGRVEHAFKLNVALEPIQKKLRDAEHRGELTQGLSFEKQLKEAKEKQILTSNEIEQLSVAEAARMDSLQVDEFSFNYFTRKHSA